MSANIESHEIFVGAIVSWMHSPRGGYGYVIPEDATVISVNAAGDRVVIEVVTKAGSVVFLKVKTSSLRWRQKKP